MARNLSSYCIFDLDATIIEESGQKLWTDSYTDKEDTAFLLWIRILTLKLGNFYLNYFIDLYTWNKVSLLL